MVNVQFNVRFYAISYGMFPTIDSRRCDSISGGKLHLDTNIYNFLPFSNFHNTTVAPFSTVIAPCFKK